VVFGSVRKAARFAAMITAKTSDRPKIFNILLLARSASVRPLTSIQARPNNAFEYHRPPRTNVERAAASTASQLR